MPDPNSVHNFSFLKYSHSFAFYYYYTERIWNFTLKVIFFHWQLFFEYLAWYGGLYRNSQGLTVEGHGSPSTQDNLLKNVYFQWTYYVFCFLAFTFAIFIVLLNHSTRRSLAFTILCMFVSFLLFCTFFKLDWDQATHDWDHIHYCKSTKTTYISYFV